jgi:hypothetical protein
VIHVNLHRVERLERHIAKFTRAVPYAVKGTLNDTAFAAREEWVRQLQSTFTLRNKWTERGLRVDKASGRTVAGMQSVVGSLREYMREREDGSTETKRGKHGVAIPKSGASGQGKKAKRTRPVRAVNYLSTMQLQKRVTGTDARKNTVAIMMAKKAGGGVVLLEKRRRKGLFRVEPSTKKPRLLYDLSKTMVTTKPYPTLQRTLEVIEPKRLAIWEKNLEAQLARNKVLHYGW